MYYLNARYYNPQWRRFISPDDTAYLDPESVNGLNLYCYCNNDPINYADPSGHEAKWWQWLLGGIGIALVAVAAGLAIWGTGGVAAFGIGALIGSVALGATGAAIGGAVGYATGGTEGVLGGALTGFGIGAIVGFVVGGCIGYYNFHGHSVYISRLEDGTVNYVGRTNSIARRTVEHANAGRGVAPQEVAKKLTLRQARGLEQALINKYGMIKNGGTLINRINSIAASNPIYSEAVAWGNRYILTHWWKFL